MKFGLISVAFWESYFERLWGCFGVSGAPFWRPGGAQRSDFGGVQGSILAPFWVPFGTPQAPGQAPRDSLCSKGGLDRFLERFWEANGSPRGAKMIPKSI